MEFPFYTAMATSVLTFLLTGLGLLTSFGRRKHGQSLGTGEIAVLQKRSRAHGNLAEYAPLYLFTMALLEMSGAGHNYIAIIASLFVVARFLQAIGMLGKDGPNVARFIGSLMTYLIGFILSVWLIVHIHFYLPVS
ncbi:MAG: MAPEG family protein [bacterium]